MYDRQPQNEVEHAFQPKPYSTIVLVL